MTRHVSFLVMLIACGPKVVESRPEGGGAVAIEVVATSDDTPKGGDGPPRLSLAFRLADGERIPIAGEATAYVPFRDGVALVDLQRRLVLVAPDGSRRVLALDAGAPPARGPDGALYYVARQGLNAEVHALDVHGRDRILASGLASAGVLAPQADGRLLFVGARNGGVAGVFIAERGTARCLSNCELATGTPWGDRFVPLPRAAAALRVTPDRVEWDASDGSRRAVSLAPAGAPASGGDVIPPAADGELRAAPHGDAP